ncbi:hypothetical protein D0544_00060 [Aestuariirhabdus litorea]|uniref:Uncharacterized protein n=1 Tax=Aestuariirhabdus litorea TaxID=2528527 RepID=A0A3P3VMJ0_9GAMM|nr:hypothetical protein D0544_00060 [Aestuariirhabdus litorea]
MGLLLSAGLLHGEEVRSTDPLCGLYSQRVAEILYSPTALWQRTGQPLQAIRLVEDLEAQGRYCAAPPRIQSHGPGSALLCAELDRLFRRHSGYLARQWAVSESDGQSLSLFQLMGEKRGRYCPGALPLAIDPLRGLTRALSFTLLTDPSIPALPASAPLPAASLPASGPRLSMGWYYLGGSAGLHPHYR